MLFGQREYSKKYPHGAPCFSIKALYLLYLHIRRKFLADEIDQANETAERWLAQSLVQLAASATRLQPRGACYYCETVLTGELADKRLFCDKDCAADFEKEQQLLNRR